MLAHLLSIFAPVFRLRFRIKAHTLFSRINGPDRRNLQDFFFTSLFFMAAAPKQTSAITFDVFVLRRNECKKEREGKRKREILHVFSLVKKIRAKNAVL